MLSIFFAIGAISTLFGGRLADKYGYKKIIILAFLLLLPSIFLLTMTSNVVVATLILVVIGFALNLSYSPMVVLGQKYLPNRLGLASGVTLGLSVSVGGIVAPVLGNLADNHGLLAAMHVVALIAVIPAIVAFMLPKSKETFNKTQEHSLN
ncbi:Major Facilitator Superfamily protein [compost metagenome]